MGVTVLRQCGDPLVPLTLPWGWGRGWGAWPGRPPTFAPGQHIPLRGLHPTGDAGVLEKGQQQGSPSADGRRAPRSTAWTVQAGPRGVARAPECTQECTHGRLRGESQQEAGRSAPSQKSQPLPLRGQRPECGHVRRPVCRVPMRSGAQGPDLPHRKGTGEVSTPSVTAHKPGSHAGALTCPRRP